MKNGEEPIYPVKEDGFHNENARCIGLTKREYFAGLAMQGLITNPNYSGTSWEELAQKAVICSDKLLTQLSKP